MMIPTSGWSRPSRNTTRRHRKAGWDRFSRSASFMRLSNPRSIPPMTPWPSACMKQAAWKCRGSRNSWGSPKLRSRPHWVMRSISIRYEAWTVAMSGLRLLKCSPAPCGPSWKGHAMQPGWMDATPGTSRRWKPSSQPICVRRRSPRALALPGCRSETSSPSPPRCSGSRRPSITPPRSPAGPWKNGRSWARPRQRQSGERNGDMPANCWKMP
ncbi:hypothetical protein GLUCOINTEAF2_0204066 [Komagataeibacter intermedius AF2]|uniref:Uncharacterized protein n=1 Tax=Komagataeibacter intermedius AF2 TaxID=1458464 RepID=A0A0C1UVY5_9PROT|nr:hypothetical protein GLUCOINTEAF2_0204066 [Komagataeibacter intermedius AF2]